MLKLALASLWSRRGSALITIMAIAVSTLLLLGVSKIKQQTQDNFANTIAGTDLIVGGRTSNIQLLLSSVFHIGNLTNTLSWESYQALTELPGVAWHVPIALGDSVKGLPVVATEVSYFTYFRYAQQQPLTFQQGQSFAETAQAVLGAEAAQRLQLQVGDALTVAHGSGGVSFSEHDQHPFRVSGILAATGTPVDQAVYIPLTGLGLVHGEYEGGADEADAAHPHDHEHDAAHEHDHQHDDHQHGHAPAQSNGNADSSIAPPVYTLSAVLIGLEQRALALRLQRQINTYRSEPLTAIMPGLTLQELWRSLQLFERALFGIAALVALTGLLGMLTALLTSLRERRREMAILRAVGAGPARIFLLLVSEALLLTAIGITVGVVSLFVTLTFADELLQQWLGLKLSATGLSLLEWQWLGAIITSAVILSFIPAWRAYRHALSDGLVVK